MTTELGRALPQLRTEVPGPASRELARRLALVESPNITAQYPEPPIFWREAHGANVMDVDGNLYLDLTAGFSVAAAGFSAPAVVHAISEQSRRLAHGLGDVHPSELKVQLLEKLAEITPGDLNVAILASAGAEAVEAALKTAMMRTGKPGILAFEDSYHGLTYGALATTHRKLFRAPFEEQLSRDVHFAPFPTNTHELPAAIDRIDQLLALHPGIGAILVEPIQGRGGINWPAPGFLQALRARCDAKTRVLIFDEIYTGMGRTGKWFACEWYDVIPDILAVGKGLTGSVPLSAAIATPDVMSAWPPSEGEAIHTSTFLGNPIACAAAIAHITAIESGNLMASATRIGETIATAARDWADRYACVHTVRGLGGLQGIEFQRADVPSPVRLMQTLLKQGIIVLPEGTWSEVLAITPALTISGPQLSYALERIEAAIAELG